MSKADQLSELYELELLQADGFDDAILGVVFDHMNAVPRLAYSVSKCIKILMERDGMTFEEAMQAEMRNDGGSEPMEQVVNLDGDSL